MESSGLTSRRGMITKDLLRFSWVEELAICPRGETIAYTVRRPDRASNGYTADLYLYRVESGQTQEVTGGDGLASSIAWSRDGTKLAFSWAGGVCNSVHVLSVDTGQETHYTVDGEPMTQMSWSSNGRWLAGARWTPVSQETLEDDEALAPTVRVIRRLRYKQDGAGYVHDRFKQIWVLDTETEDLVQFTDQEIDYSEPNWSEKGDRLAFIAMAREQNTELGQGQIMVCEYPGGTPRPLLENWVGACRSPVWGDGDRSIAFAGHRRPNPTNRRTFMVPFLADIGTGTATELVPGLNDQIGNYGVSDQRKGLSNVTVKWASGDAWIYYLLTLRGCVHLYRVDQTGKVECLIDGRNIVFEYSPAPGSRVAYGMANPRNPGEVHFWDGGSSRCITSLNPWLDEVALSMPEKYTYKGLDGVPVDAWLMKPPNMDETKKHPCIVYVHCSMFSDDFNHELQCLANKGFLVAYFNQRGTTAGYGQQWTRATEGRQGGEEYDEIMMGVDDLLTRPYVDADRLGVTGGSCGGFMTNWIVGHTDRFAAAVTQRSISNYVSFYGTSDFGPEYVIGETGTDPWADLDSVWAQSPLAYAPNVTTPLLILHSDEDFRCSVEQAEELFAALRWMGREVELVVFLGENHGLSRGGRPGNRIERIRRISGWFEKYLQR